MTTKTTSNLTQEKAIEMATEIIRLEATVKEMKKQLKAYVKENGELVTGDSVWKFQETYSWKFDSDKIKEFMKHLVIDGYTTDPYSLVSFSKTDLDKLGLNDDYISNYAEKKSSERFVNRKK